MRLLHCVAFKDNYLSFTQDQGYIDINHTVRFTDLDKFNLVMVMVVPFKARATFDSCLSCLVMDDSNLTQNK